MRSSPAAQQLADRTPERIEAADVLRRRRRTSSRARTAPATSPRPTPSTCRRCPSSTRPPSSRNQRTRTRPLTGHADRVDRDHRPVRQRRLRSRELVAELGAAMWCAQFGISAVSRPDHAAYLAGWPECWKTDARALVTVSSRAQAARLTNLSPPAPGSPPPARRPTPPLTPARLLMPRPPLRRIAVDSCLRRAPPPRLNAGTVVHRSSSGPSTRRRLPPITWRGGRLGRRA